MIKNIIIVVLSVILALTLGFGVIPKIVKENKASTHIVFEDSTQIENLQLKGGTIKIIASQVLGLSDTTITNTFMKWRADYIDGTPPNDNANVTISRSATTAVAFFYSVLLDLPAGLTEVEDFIGDFKTSIQSKRAANSYLDRLCDELELAKTNKMADIKSQGLKNLSSQ